jgi:hypothetical protein
MLNHEPGRITGQYVPDDQSLVLEAMRDFATNTEVTMSYGTRPKSELLFYQGFLPTSAETKDKAGAEADNEEEEEEDDDDEVEVDDEIVLRQQLAPGDPLTPLKTGLLTKLGVHWNQHAQPHVHKLIYKTSPPTPLHALKESDLWSLPFDFAYAGGAMPEEVVTFLRVAALTKSDAAVALRAAQSAIQAATAAAQAPAEAGCNGDHGAHGHSHGSHGHGHSHGGGQDNCEADHGHGHSHGGNASASHGHSHGSASAASQSSGSKSGGGSHGHSHNGQPCGGHGHGQGSGQPDIGPVLLPPISDANELAVVASLRSSLLALKSDLQVDLEDAAAHCPATAADASTVDPATVISTPHIITYLKSQLKIVDEGLAALPQ